MMKQFDVATDHSSVKILADHITINHEVSKMRLRDDTGAIRAEFNLQDVRRVAMYELEGS